MVRNYYRNIYTNWREILSDGSIRNQAIILVVLYIFLLKFCKIIMSGLETRQGTQLNDLLLSMLPSYDFSGITLLLTYTALILFILSTIVHPKIFIIGLQGYCLLAIMRTITIYLVPLEPPANMILLWDPITVIFLSKPGGGYIVKDLFFSGHVSAIMLFFFVTPNKVVKPLLWVLGVLISWLLLIQHVHYTIDIMAAPLFAFLAFKSSLYLDKLIHQKKYATLTAEFNK